MRCGLHCPPDGGFLSPVLAGLRAALAVLGIAALAGWALEAVSLWAGIAAGIFAVDAVMAVVAYRLVRYGTLRKPVGRPRARAGIQVSSALPAPPLELEAPRAVVAGVVVAEADKVRP